MIFNISKSTHNSIEKYKSGDTIDTFVTDAAHIFGNRTGTSDFVYNPFPFRGATKIWLTWKDGDKVDTHATRATNTLLINPYAFWRIGVTDVYIPYASSVETFNPKWRETSDHSDDNYVYEQLCFDTTGAQTIHVNSALYNYMTTNSNVWGNVISHVVNDL